MEVEVLGFFVCEAVAFSEGVFLFSGGIVERVDVDVLVLLHY